MFVGVGVVNAAPNVVIPETLEVKVGETKNVTITITDLVALMDIKSDNNNVKLGQNVLDLKSEGEGTASGTFAVTGVKAGSSVITVSSDDSAVFSAGAVYDFPTKTIKVTVKDASSSGTNSGNTTPSNNNNNNNNSSSNNNSSEEIKGSEETSNEKVTENPKTGVFSYVLPVSLIIVAGIVAYRFIKKARKFN